MNALPLIVDLDGTLINTDMLHESAIRVLRDKPLSVLAIPFWLMKGKAELKQKLAKQITLSIELLPYNETFIEWLKQQKTQGRTLILCTASDTAVAAKIAEFVGIFDEVIASDGKVNLAGSNKAEYLKQRFGEAGFDYAGNANVDLAIWRYANAAIVVNASSELLKKVQTVHVVKEVFSIPKPGVKTWLKMLRVHQWLKNLLLFAPLLAAHELTNWHAWIALIIAFIAFGLCASSVYVMNDLLDLDNDRQHPRKRNRPFAAGYIPIWIGVCLAPVLLLSGLLVASYVGGTFLPWLTGYFILTCLYSFLLKRIMLIDCLVLAILYTVRITAGAAAVQIPLSFWLLTFSIFLFLSLAFVKRYAELEIQLLRGQQKVKGRGYYTTDAPLIQTLGIASGYLSVLVLALYLQSHVVLTLYQFPEFIWGAVPIMLFWISWMWMQAHRGEMHDDPLVFAIKDKASLIAGFAFIIVLVISTIGLPW